MADSEGRHVGRKRKVSARRRRLHGRVLVVGVAALVAFLYYRPIGSYLETRGDVERRQAEVQQLRAERARLEVKLERSTSDAALRREARRIGFVRPGERLFIVKGIPEWRRAHQALASPDDD